MSLFTGKKSSESLNDSSPQVLTRICDTVRDDSTFARHDRRMNALLVIAPYKYQGTWVFDDPAVGLSREPFIAGIDTMIDKAVADIPNVEKGFRAIFSASPFPGANLKLDWCREESGGNWYYNDRFKMEGWLCPALLKYFPTAPREIYVKIEPKN